MKRNGLLFLCLLGLMGCQTNTQDPSSKPNDEQQDVVEDNQDEESYEDLVMFKLDELPEEELRYLNYLGRVENYDVYYSTPYYNHIGNLDEADNGLMFYYTKPSTFEVVKTGEMEPLLSPKIKLIQDKIYVMKPDMMVEISNKFEEIQHLEMPKQIADEASLYGFDVSDDLSKFTYSNQEGLWYLSDITAEPVLLREPLKYDENPLIDFGYYLTPTFINEGKDLITDVGAYEASAGYVFCDLSQLTCDSEPSGTQQSLFELNHNQQFLQLATSTGEYIPWEYQWLNLKTKTKLDELVSFETIEGETRQIDGYLQLEDRMYLAIGTRDEGKFLAKSIEIVVYQIEENGSLSFIEQLEEIDDIGIMLLGATPEGNVIYSCDHYDAENNASEYKIYLTK